jgi:micrococcal nuclease
LFFGEETCTSSPIRAPDGRYTLARLFFALMLAVGLVLAGCGTPATEAERSQGDRGSDKQAREERRADAQPSVENQVSPAKRDGGTEKRPEPKPKEEPEPALAASASASPSASASAPAEGLSGAYDTTVTVSRVVDGDTIEVSPAVDGNDEVRLIGVDTPETKDPSEGIEPYGPEASAFATDDLTGQRVGLEFDVEREDQYDRLLAYVYVGEEMFNEVLLEEGYAQAYPYEPNTRYEDRFAAAQEEARAAGLGIWGLSQAQQCELADRGNGIGEGTPSCEGASASPSAPASPSATATASASASASAGLGGGAPASSGGDIDCDQVNGPIRTPPGDPDNLDGDGDGLACE